MALNQPPIIMRQGVGDDLSPPSPDRYQPTSTFGKEGYYDGFGADAEKGGYGGQARKMSRIDKPFNATGGGNDLTADDDTDPSISVGKQMELEAGNTIKYRTCSWQKV